uniref:EGF-like domain-containing protein n=1 Tax=Ascaris lumbricoides TaxID=6252 RepID=A0A0M3I2B2_ASCLU
MQSRDNFSQCFYRKLTREMFRLGRETFIALLTAVHLSTSQMSGMNAINMRSHFVDDDGKACNVNDEASFCQTVVIDTHMTLVAINHRCDCPNGYRCPNDPFNTIISPRCEYVVEKKLWLCTMRCVPNESFKRYPKRQMS